MTDVSNEWELPSNVQPPRLKSRKKTKDQDNVVPSVKLKEEEEEEGEPKFKGRRPRLNFNSFEAELLGMDKFILEEGDSCDSDTEMDREVPESSVNLNQLVPDIASMDKKEEEDKKELESQSNLHSTTAVVSSTPHSSRPVLKAVRKNNSEAGQPSRNLVKSSIANSTPNDALPPESKRPKIETSNPTNAQLMTPVIIKHGIELNPQLLKAYKVLQAQMNQNGGNSTRCLPSKTSSSAPFKPLIIHVTRINVILPIKSVASLNALERKVTEEPKVKSALYERLSRVNGADWKNCMQRILNTLTTPEVRRGMTWTSSPGKMEFGKSLIKSISFDAVRFHFSQATNPQLEEVARDWFREQNLI